MSQLLQAVDPMYLAEVEIGRHARGNVSLALQDMRTDRGLTQAQIPDLSERHVRRLEHAKSRLTVDAAERLAAAFGLDLSAFLEELGRKTASLREATPRAAHDRP